MFTIPIKTNQVRRPKLVLGSAQVKFDVWTGPLTNHKMQLAKKIVMQLQPLQKKPSPDHNKTQFYSDLYWT